MSSPSEYYKSLPPVSKTYGVACLMTTAALYLQLYDPSDTIALDYGLVLKRLQVWRLITNFFFLGPFSFGFAFRLIIIECRLLFGGKRSIAAVKCPKSDAFDGCSGLSPTKCAKYGVSLEKGTFDKRTADYLWMLIFGALSLLVMTAVPVLSIPFMGPSLVFMIVYIWGREYPNARISIYGVVTLKGFYLPWAMLALDLIFGAGLMPDILGMVAGHLYYFLTVLHPLAGGNYIFKTPLWVHRLVAYWGEGTQINSPVQRDPFAGVVFRGRSYRLNGTRTRTPEQAQTGTGTGTETETETQQPNNQDGGVTFRGRSYRLNDET